MPKKHSRFSPNISQKISWIPTYIPTTHWLVREIIFLNSLQTLSLIEELISLNNENNRQLHPVFNGVAIISSVSCEIDN